MTTEKKPVLPPTLEDLKGVAPKDFVRLFNRSGRTFLHHGFKAVPNTFVLVPSALADFWLDRYPDLIVEAAVAAREFGGANAKIAEIQAKLDEALRKVALLEATPKNERASAQVNSLQAQINDLSAKNKSLELQVTDLTTQLEQATEPSKPGAGSV